MTTEPGQEEGERCNRDGCDGIIELTYVEDCYCHISPPCGNCMEQGYCCPNCEWDSRE